jgi:plastocyanin
MPTRRLFGLVLALCIPGLAGACGGASQETAPAATNQPAAAPVDSATAGSVTGKVVLDGLAPKNALLKMDADPACVPAAKTPLTQETFMVGEGGAFQNVFVYVKDGLGSRTFPTPTAPVTIDQQGCRYHPHVLGIRVGQPLEMVNSDPTVHNVHAMATANQEFNIGEPVQGMKMTHTFTSREIMVPLKCDVHPWMNAYVGVLDHPYFAVTGADGRFDLRTLPPGTYTIEAWHEKLGTMTQSVTVGEKETKEITFTFKAPAATTN